MSEIAVTSQPTNAFKPFYSFSVPIFYIDFIRIIFILFFSFFCIYYLLGCV